MLNRRNGGPAGRPINIRVNHQWKYNDAKKLVDLEALSNEMKGIEIEQ